MWYKTGQTNPHVFDTGYPHDAGQEQFLPSPKWGIEYPASQKAWRDSFQVIEENLGNGRTNVGFEFDPFYKCDKCDPTQVTCFECTPGDETTGAFSKCSKGDVGAAKTVQGDIICPEDLGPSHGMHMFNNWQSKFQTIQRFAYGNTSRQTSANHQGVNNQPVYYIEVDYNSEGIARGPGPNGGSFLQPHFDFHFYVKPWMDVRSQTCSSLNGANIWGRTCPLLNIPPIETANFLAIPFQFMPNDWKPDLGSSIPLMGMHSFDEAKLPPLIPTNGSAQEAAPSYSVDSVFTHPPQLVGTYRGQVQFVEASPVVPFVNKMVVDGRKQSKDMKYSYPFPKPVLRVPVMAAWPESFNLEYSYSTNKLKAYMQFTTFAKLPGVVAVCGDPSCDHCTNISNICLPN